MSDLERRVSDLEANEQARKIIEKMKDKQREAVDQDLADAVKCLRKEVYELKSWKMKLYYPFAIVGVFVMGSLTWLGANFIKLFTGE